jgi:hypothetical protein
MKKNFIIFSLVPQLLVDHRLHNNAQAWFTLYQNFCDHSRNFKRTDLVVNSESVSSNTSYNTSYKT